ncbi:hypothetical protein GCM10022243_68180 [Saccharothrix violaceirubra]
MLAVGVLLAGTVQAHAVDGNLPGGTGIGVTVTSPTPGTLLSQGAVTVTGTAQIGAGQPVRDTALTYVVDASGSTGSACAGGPTILGCEVGSTRRLNAIAAQTDTVVAAVGAVAFGNGAATIDVRPAAGDQLVTAPGADEDGNGIRDIEDALSSITPGAVSRFTPKTFPAATDYVPAVNAATSVTNAQTQRRKIVLFLSDGFSSTDVRAVASAQPAAVDYLTFAVGTGARCRGANYNSSLQALADLTGGRCTEVLDPSTLPNIVPGVIASQLTDLSLSIDGGTPIAVSSVTPALPRPGPTSVTYSVTTPTLSSGTHSLCVTARGTDGGGAGTVAACTNVVVNNAPTVLAGGPYAGAEGSAVSLAGTVTDPDGPPAAVQWTATAQSGVDAGAACTFSDSQSLTTSVTCDDDGVWALRLTADDGLHTAVVATTTLSLTNVAPSVSVSSPATGTVVARGGSVTVVAPFTDAGRHDTHTCTIDFVDGTAVETGTVSNGQCTASHTSNTIGSRNVLVRVTDDDGGAGTAVVQIVTYVRGESWDLSATSLVPGLLTVAKTPLATCPPSSTQTTASLNVTGLASVSALRADCTLDMTNGRTTATASISGASLLAGAISLSDVQSTCTMTASGPTGASRVGTLNGQSLGTASATISLLGVATIYVNQTTTLPTGELAQYAVRVVTLLGQEIVIAGCRIGF